MNQLTNDDKQAIRDAVEEFLIEPYPNALRIIYRVIPSQYKLAAVLRGMEGRLR